MFKVVCYESCLETQDISSRKIKPVLNRGFFAALLLSALKFELGGNKCKILYSIVYAVAITVEVSVEPYSLVYFNKKAAAQVCREKIRKGGKKSKHII